MLPIFFTIVIFLFLLTKINRNVLNPMIEIIGLHFYNPVWIYITKALGFVVIILLVSLIGAATKLILLRRFFGFWERLLLYVPMIGKIYTTIKEISSAFLGQGKRVFEKVALVEYPYKGIYSLGFITAQACQEIQEKSKSNIVYAFIPTTPNPTNGFFLLVPEEKILPLEMSVADGFKLIVSGGAFSPAMEKPENP